VYSPKWTSTTYTLLRLLWLGLPSGHPAALRGCEQIWRWRAGWRVPETCIVAILVRLNRTSGPSRWNTCRVLRVLQWWQP
jgi:hypothetical protein